MSILISANLSPNTISVTIHDPNVGEPQHSVFVKNLATGVEITKQNIDITKPTVYNNLVAGNYSIYAIGNSTFERSNSLTVTLGTGIQISEVSHDSTSIKLSHNELNSTDTYKWVITGTKVGEIDKTTIGGNTVSFGNLKPDTYTCYVTNITKSETSNSILISTNSAKDYYKFTTSPETSPGANDGFITVDLSPFYADPTSHPFSFVSLNTFTRQSDNYSIIVDDSYTTGYFQFKFPNLKNDTYRFTLSNANENFKNYLDFYIRLGSSISGSTSIVIDKIQIKNESIPRAKDGSIFITAHNDNQSIIFYSLDGINYQLPNQFFQLKSGNYTIFAKDASGFLTGNIFIPEIQPIKKINYQDYFNNSTEVRIYQSNVDALPQNLIGTGNPVVIQIAGDGISERYQAIKGSELQLNLISETNYQYTELFFTSENFKYRADILKNNKLFWTGFITPELSNEPYQNAPYPVTIHFTDQLGALKNYSLDKFENLVPEGYSYTDNKVSLWQLLKIILRQTKLYIPLNIAVNLLDATMLNIPLVLQDKNAISADTITYSQILSGATQVNVFEKLFVSIFSLITNNDNRFDFYYKPTYKNSYDILESILKCFNARIYQDNGEWFIVNVNIQKENYNIIKYDAQFNFVSNSEVNPFLYLAPNLIPVLDGSGELTVNPGLSNVTITKPNKALAGGILKDYFDRADFIYNPNYTQIDGKINLKTLTSDGLFSIDPFNYKQYDPTTQVDYTKFQLRFFDASLYTNLNFPNVSNYPFYLDINNIESVKIILDFFVDDGYYNVFEGQIKPPADILAYWYLRCGDQYFYSNFPTYDHPTTGKTASYRYISQGTGFPNTPSPANGYISTVIKRVTRLEILFEPKIYAYYFWQKWKSYPLVFSFVPFSKDGHFWQTIVTGMKVEFNYKNALYSTGDTQTYTAKNANQNYLTSDDSRTLDYATSYSSIDDNCLLLADNSIPVRFTSVTELKDKLLKKEYSLEQYQGAENFFWWLNNSNQDVRLQSFLAEQIMEQSTRPTFTWSTTIKAVRNLNAVYIDRQNNNKKFGWVGAKYNDKKCEVDLALFEIIPMVQNFIPIQFHDGTNWETHNSDIIIEHSPT